MHRVSDVDGVPLPGRDMSITGYFFGVLATQGARILPWLVSIEDRTFLPVFSTLDKLLESHKLAKSKELERIKKITDGRLFLASVSPTYQVIADPQPTGYGTTRFTLIMPAGDSK